MINLDKNYINRLLYFYFVATCKNISRAAHETGLHQSALSRQMSNLEKEVGMKLLVRSSEGVILTSKGEELFEYAQRIFMEVQASRKQLEEKEGICGKIRISTTHAVMNYILADHLIEFQKKYPQVKFELVCNDYVIDLVKNNVDVVIKSYVDDMTTVKHEPLFHLQGKLFASRKYVEKNGYPKTAQDLSTHKFIIFGYSDLVPPYFCIDWVLNLNGYTSPKNCFMRVNNVELLYKYAEAGFGIIIGYENMDILKKSNLILVAPEVKNKPYNMYFIYPEKNDHLKRIKELKIFLQQRLTQL